MSTMQPYPAHVYPIVIRPSQIDVFGHVNNAKYLEIFEEARWDLIERAGFGLKRIQRDGVGPVILEAKLQFRRELAKGDRCEVRTQTTKIKGKIFWLEQKLLRASDQVSGDVTWSEACVAEFTGGLFDLGARKLVEPTPDWLRAIGALEGT